MDNQTARIVSALFDIIVAEQARKQELRQHSNVVLLEDWR